MPTERHAFTVSGAPAAVVELDREAGAIYIRLSSRPVARTVDQHAEKMHVAVDLDAQGEVVGIEAVGTTRFTFRHILEAARVQGPGVDFGNAPIVLGNSAPT